MENKAPKINPPIIIIYGVSGAGKSTIAKAVATKLEVPFYDADDFHSPVNIAKMAAGIPLNDEDRLPWLQTINQQMIVSSKGKGGVFACSALKEKYRVILAKNLSIPPSWFLLNGSFEVILERMETRQHFMPPELLQSQFDALEIPNYGEVLDITKTKEALVAIITTSKHALIK